MVFPLVKIPAIKDDWIFALYKERKSILRILVCKACISLILNYFSLLARNEASQFQVELKNAKSKNQNRNAGNGRNM